MLALLSTMVAFSKNTYLFTINLISWWSSSQVTKVKAIEATWKMKSGKAADLFSLFLDVLKVDCEIITIIYIWL